MAGLVLRGGRVLDPETGLDGIRDVVIRGGSIQAVAPRAAGTTDAAVAGLGGGVVEVDVSGLVVAPGFIDLHSHVTDPATLLLRACDGVTTALELECGALGVQTAAAAAETVGLPVNVGFSASWALARMAACGLPVGEGFAGFVAHIADPAWLRRLAGHESARVLDILSRQLGDGALGVGVLLGYCAPADATEYLAVAELATGAASPVWTHVREFGRPDGGVFGAGEVVDAALVTGAHMHLCHVNSSAVRYVDTVHTMLAAAMDRGLRVTTEAYPYGAGMTGIGAAWLAPDRLDDIGLRPADLHYLPTDESVRDADHLSRLRATDPGGLVAIRFLDEADPLDRGLLTGALLPAGTAVASDAVPLVAPGEPGQPLPWPLPEGTLGHPRVAGTFGRVLRWYVRELGVMSLIEAVRRCTLVPATILAEVAPAASRKGRVQVGCDADLVVFDPDTVTDRASYARPTLPSAGFRHVIVNGEFVVRDGVARPDVRPGRVLRGG